MLLITGGTGSNGQELIKLLSSRGVSLRAMVRNPEKATSLRLPGVELVPGDFGDAASLKSALQGVTKAFLLAPAVEEIDKIERAFIDAAQAVGVKQIVNLSAVGAGIDVPHRFGLWHGRTEQYLKQSGMQYTILRPNFFLQNLLGFAGMVKGGTLYVPAGTEKAPFVDIRDIAAVAAACLTEPGHEGQTYDVTGPVALGYADIAKAFTTVLGRTVTYVDVPPEAALKSMTDGGMPRWFAEAVNELTAGMKAGQFSAVSTVVERIGRKKPVSIEQFIQENIATFQ